MISKKSRKTVFKNKICLFVSILFFAVSSYGESNYVITNTNTGTSIPVTTSGGGNFQATLNSTSVDWEAVTGLNLMEYNLKFVNTNAIQFDGWEIYYLDSFPCYGYGQYVRIWLNMRDSEGSIRLNCVRQPHEIMLAQREAKKDDSQGVTTNLLKCKVHKDLSVALDKCEKKTWKEFLKDSD